MKEKTLIDWFNEQNEKFPERGRYINLCFTIHRSGAERKEITEAFDQLISKSDYLAKERREMINYLVQKAKDE